LDRGYTNNLGFPPTATKMSPLCGYNLLLLNMPRKGMPRLKIVQQAFLYLKLIAVLWWCGRAHDSAKSYVMVGLLQARYSLDTEFRSSTSH